MHNHKFHLTLEINLIVKFSPPHCLGGSAGSFWFHCQLLFLSEDGEEAMHQDTDSDVAEQRDGGKLKVKWTQEEVIVKTCPSDLHVLRMPCLP